MNSIEVLICTIHISTIGCNTFSQFLISDCESFIYLNIKKVSRLVTLTTQRGVVCILDQYDSCCPNAWEDILHQAILYFLYFFNQIFIVQKMTIVTIMEHATFIMEDVIAIKIGIFNQIALVYTAIYIVTQAKSSLMILSMLRVIFQIDTDHESLKLPEPGTSGL